MHATLGQSIAIRKVETLYARRLGRPMPAPMLIRKASIRRLRLPAVKASINRPKFSVGNASLQAEDAVIQHLMLCKRNPIRAENRIWTSIVAGLFSDLITKDFPAPALSCPLGFQSGAFYQRHRTSIETLLAKVSEGLGVQLLQRALSRYMGMRVGGCTLGALPPSAQILILNHLPGSVVAAIVREWIRHPRDSRKGMPDIFVPSATGAATRVPSLIPSVVPMASFWIEVKTRNDSVRPSQSAWHHRLLALGQNIELWELRAQTPAVLGQQPGV